MNAVSTSPRLDIIDFATRMCDKGEVLVTVSGASPQKRVVVRDSDAPGFRVIGITVTDGMPNTCVMDFDLTDREAMQHVLSADGQSLVLRDENGRVSAEYRIPTATHDLMFRLEAALDEVEFHRARADVAEARLRQIEQNG